MGQLFQIAAVAVADVEIGAAAFAQDHGDFAAIGGNGRIEVAAAEAGEQGALAAGGIVFQDLGVAAFPGGVIEFSSARRPGRGGDQRGVVGHLHRVMAVEIGDEQFQVGAHLAAEGDFAVKNGRRVADDFHDVIGKGVGLGASGAAVIEAGETATASAGGLQAPIRPFCVPLIKYSALSGVVSSSPKTDKSNFRTDSASPVKPLMEMGMSRVAVLVLLISMGWASPLRAQLHRNASIKSGDFFIRRLVWFRG